MYALSMTDIDEMEFYDSRDTSGLISAEETNRKKRKLFCKSKAWLRNILIFITVAIMLSLIVVILVFFAQEHKQASPTGYYEHAAVASDAPQCSVLGKSILQKNGSAVDAAIVSLLCAGVYNAQSCGLGGGFFMIVYDVPRNGTSKTMTVFDAREVAPLAATEDMFSDQSSRVGGLSIAVPGEIQGYYTAWLQYGRLPWKDLVEPVASLCRDGFEVNYALANTIKNKESVIRATPSLRELFVKADGQVYAQGDYMKRIKLGHTLQKISQIKSLDELQNTVFSDMVSDIKDHGGIVTAEDFARYKVKVTTPLSVPLHTNNLTLHSLRPPSSGIILSFILRLLEGFNLTSHDILNDKSSAETYHKFIESFKFSYALRSYLGDEDIVNNTEMMNSLMSQKFADEIRSKINLTHTRNTQYYGPEAQIPSDGGTSHLSVLASNGGAVAATSTINQFFGSQRVGQRTGVIFNDEMDDFSIPGHNDSLPFSRENVIAPGKRPMSSMCPTIILDQHGKVVYIIGASGGSFITTGVSWVMAHTLWLGKRINEAVDVSRYHDQLLPTGISIEKNSSQAITDWLLKKGHTVRDEHIDNVVQAIHNRCGSTPKDCNCDSPDLNCCKYCITAVSDRRKGGVPSGY